VADLDPGGDIPRWRRDSKELYYIALDGTLMACPVKVTSTFEPGVPVPLFEITSSSYSFFPYDIASDGRFLINTVGNSASPVPITIVLNWMAGLKK
jgi:hypothetical protein